MNGPLDLARTPSPARADINGSQFTATVIAGPELHQLQDGTAMSRLEVVIVEPLASASDRVKHVRVPIVTYGDRAEKVCRELGPGWCIAVAGSLDYREAQPTTGRGGELRVLAGRLTPIADHDNRRPTAREDINRCQFTATVIAGPELHRLRDGRPMSRFHVVIMEPPASASGRVKHVRVPIVTYGDRAEKVCREVRPGCWIAVAGSLDYREAQPTTDRGGELRVLAGRITPIGTPSDPDDRQLLPALHQQPPPSAPSPVTRPSDPPPDPTTATVLEEYGLGPGSC